MGFVKEFKDFAMRGNVVDLAVGIIIGGAFGNIVSSLVADILMPPLGLLLGGVDFSDLKIVLREGIPASLDAGGAVLAEAVPAVTLNFGNFIQVLVDFILIGFAIFLVIKTMNAAKKKKVEAPAAPLNPPAPTEDQKLLAEIRDLLKNK